MGLFSATMAIGQAFSGFLSSWFFEGAETERETKDALNSVLIVQCCIICFNCLLFQISFEERPKIPPSAVALAPEVRPSLLEGLKQIWHNKSLRFLTISMASYIGLYFSLGNFISSLFAPLGFGPMEIAAMALTMIGGGVIGAALTGFILDKTAAYKKMIVSFILITALFLGLLGLELLTSKKMSYLLFINSVLGITMISVLPASLGLGIELSFPMLPAMVTGVMMMTT